VVALPGVSPDETTWPYAGYQLVLSAPSSHTIRLSRNFRWVGLMFNPKGGYLMFSNVLDFRVALPIEIAPTLRIERATESQVAKLQSMLTHMCPGFSNARGYYENSWETTKTSETSWDAFPTPLAPEDWRYFLLTFSGNGMDAHHFLRAANLVPPYLNSFANVHTDGEFGTGNAFAWGGDELHSVLTYQSSDPRTLQVVDSSHLNEARASYLALKTLDQRKHAGIARAVTLLYGLRWVSASSDLRVLGLFAVIEMLLTHNPNEKELGDSLSHQISTKIPLLSARFSNPVSYDTFAKNTDPQKIWKKLYSYRSKIAHGDTVDFASGLQVLKDRHTTNTFLEEFTRRLVRHALREPELVDGLKPI
jgi:hypothetical protein